MEKSNIKNMDINYLIGINFEKNQINLIYDLVSRGIKEKLYTNNHVLYHNIGHIERVLCYCIWILNKKVSKGENLKNTDILLYSALYHDCGRKLTVSNKMHGIISAQIARKKLRNDFNDKDLNAIKLLIETHAIRSDIINFNGYGFHDSEKENLQILSNILKDADALDRNRIKIFKFAQCNPNYLRTIEAKEIYHISNLFFKEYEKAEKANK